jgi:3-hydroxyacyl-[acyl-carrier-protein] dehydratase
MSEDIYQIIPHRPPFLFIDEILDITDTGVRASRTIRAEEPQFEGHYPGNPIMPGVLLCEAVFQAGAVFLASKLDVDVGGDTTALTPVLTRIKDAKFKNMVKPGDELIIEATHTETIGKFYFLKGKITRDGKPVMTVTFSLAMVEGDKTA